MAQYPKRLIEVDLPIKRISAHARREKSIRHGHISTLHIWWARRPLAACRAVICAALWPDPADDICPDSFREVARSEMGKWARDNLKLLSEDSLKRFVGFQRDLERLNDNVELRQALFDFIADFSNWDNSTAKEYLDTSRILTKAAHEALGGAPGTRPLVVDPFAGGGSIPLEALRMGADVFASDLNPVAVLLNKVVLEYVPKYGKKLAEEVRKWGGWIKEEAEKELSEFYPMDLDGATPIAYLWARTINCEGPGCGAEVPLLRGLWLSKKGGSAAGLRLIPDPNLKRIGIEVVVNPTSLGQGTIRRSSCTCPVCGYTTPADRVRHQFLERNGGGDDACLVAVVRQINGKEGNDFRSPTPMDVAAFESAKKKLLAKQAQNDSISLVPNEPLPYLRSIFNVNLLGIDQWGKLFNRRQCLSMVTLIEKTREAISLVSSNGDSDFAIAVGTCLCFAVDRCADYWSTLAVWAGDFVAHTFGRQALGIIWDYAEVCGFAEGSGSYSGAIGWIARCIERESLPESSSGHVDLASACEHPLPNDMAQAFITDPPYYDAVPYADLSDFFYVWLKRSIGDYYSSLFSSPLTPKKGEVVQLSERNPLYAYKTKDYFEKLMKEAMIEGRRVLEPGGLGIVVFAHKSTSGWETQIKAMIDAGWIVTGSWPIDTERPGRLRANNAAALASSIHLICRPREDTGGSLIVEKIGDWRDILSDLPTRIHEWMPRLAQEGIVGADAIFACLGPALEIFSRYTHVEKQSGEIVSLKEYLEQVWAAVAKEALNVIFAGADATGFEEDARLTAMWLWTLKTGDSNEESPEQEEGNESDEGTSGKTRTLTGYSLEYDAARKIAQGLGAHLENLGHLVAIQGEIAVLLPVAARSRYLFGKDSGEAPKTKANKKSQQMSFDFVGDLRQVEKDTGDWSGELKGKLGQTVLDQVHQSMILFAASRTEAMKRLLVEEGIGRNPMFWRLAQALSALYPSNTDEKRWVDGVLARKKGLGF